MGVKLGDWVALQDGRTGLIRTWDTETGTAIAETSSGDHVERPINFAEQRWRVLPEDGLRVQTALDPADIASRIKEKPADLVVLALKDLGGGGETAQLKQALSPQPIPVDDFERWWKRVQVRLDTDDRIDTSRAREKRYRLRREGESRSVLDLRPARQGDQRRGRVLADAPQLKAARERAAKPGPYTELEEALFRAELGLALDPTVDPTDRFMAAELGVWLERIHQDDVSTMLGDDILSVDLLRVPLHKSRATAITWGFQNLDAGGNERSTSSGTPLFQSAMAVGPPWSEQVLAGLRSRDLGTRGASEGTLGWAVPGSEDAGPLKVPDDITTFKWRVERADKMLSSLDQNGLAGLWRGAVSALNSLPSSPTHAQAISALLEQIARLTWKIWGEIDKERRPGPADLGPLRPDAVDALIRNKDLRDNLVALRQPITAWYAAEPAVYSTSLELVADGLDLDVLSLGLDAARQQISRTTLASIASNLLSKVKQSSRTDTLAADVVSLAVTTGPDDPFVSSELERVATAAAKAFIHDAPVEAGPITFSRAGWAEFGKHIRLHVEEADARVAKAIREAAEDAEDAARLRRLADTRTSALAEARMEAGSTARQDTGRLAVNLLKPVALAVGDSFEGSSLEALRDRLLGVLQRARIRPILEVGDEADFDPVRHQWVGDGYPVDHVKALSPGFVVQGEGDEDVVLVPARVVAAES